MHSGAGLALGGWTCTRGWSFTSQELGGSPHKSGGEWKQNVGRRESEGNENVRAPGKMKPRQQKSQEFQESPGLQLPSAPRRASEGDENVRAPGKMKPRQNPAPRNVRVQICPGNRDSGSGIGSDSGVQNGVGNGVQKGVQNGCRIGRIRGAGGGRRRAGNLGETRAFGGPGGCRNASGKWPQIGSEIGAEIGSVSGVEIGSGIGPGIGPGIRECG